MQLSKQQKNIMKNLKNGSTLELLPEGHGYTWSGEPGLMVNLPRSEVDPLIKAGWIKKNEEKFFITESGKKLQEE